VADKQIVVDEEPEFDADALLRLAENLDALENHPGFQALMVLLEGQSAISAAEFIEIDLASPEGVGRMKVLQNRAARPYWIRQSIAQVLLEAAQADLSEDLAEE
jgi:hypothetical protein